MRIEIPPELRDDIKKRKYKPVIRRKLVARKQAACGERYAAAKDANFQQLFQSVYDAALITNASGDILDANTRAEEFFKCSRTDFGNYSILTLVSGADESLLETLRANLKSDRFTLIQAFCQRLDGSLFPAEISVNNLQLTGRDYLCFFVRDITMRRHAEETLRSVHNAIHNSGNGIAITDTEGLFEYINPATLHILGCAKEGDLLKSRIQNVWFEAAPANGMISSVLGGKTWSGELTAVRFDDGTSVPLQVSAAANHDSDDQLVGMVFSFIDATHKKRAEEMEREAERQRVMLESIGSACHHLGQPATVLLASLGMMQKQENCIEDEMRFLLRQSITSAEKLQSILHRLNTINEYRTVQYLAGDSDQAATDGNNIIEI